MPKKLPARPNLDHLRRQAKTLLSSLETGDKEAVSIIRKHLPTAKDKTATQVLAARHRLADAQWAIARMTGFAGWPHLARHVEQLRALEGIWTFAHLEIDGAILRASELAASRILIDGDRFRTESPEATHEGIFNINVETQPHEIDIEFVAGPEAGNINHGIYRLDGDQLEICLDLNGKARPETFSTASGSGRAHETLKRASRSRPDSVTGGAPSKGRPAAPAQANAGFEFVESELLARLQGNWTPVRMIRDGMELPSAMLRTGLRTAVKNEVKISMGGKVIIHALVRFDETQEPTHVDYYNVAGAGKGTIQYGLMKWAGEDACFCIAAPGEPRPADFTCPPGLQRSFSQWRLKPREET